MGITPQIIFSSDPLADIPFLNQTDIKICVILRSQAKQKEKNNYLEIKVI